MRTNRPYLVSVPTLAVAIVFWLAPGVLRAQVKTTDVRKEATVSGEQTVIIKKEAEKKDKKKKKKPVRGWFYKLSIGATTSMVHTYQVPGIDNGLSLTVGGQLNAELKFLFYRHAWISVLSVVHSWSKTPTVGPFIKTADEANFKTFYEYRFGKTKKLGVFGALQIVAPLAPGDLVAAADTDLILTRVDGMQLTDLAPKDRRFDLTPAFSPLIFKQLAGATLRPYETTLATVDLKLSLAGQEVWADGWTIQDDKTTPELELVELQDYQQFGLQFEAEMGGKIKKNLVYAFRLELMYPFVTSIDTELSGFDLLNAEISFKVGLKLAKWASLDYVFAAKRVPLLVNQWQLVNNLVLILTANIL